MQDNFYYNYIYLNPLAPCNISMPFLDLQLLFEPIYVGKGKNSRFLDHLKEIHHTKTKRNMLKISTLIKILEFVDVETYKNNYILILNKNSNEDYVLRWEKYFIELIGNKIQSIPEVLNRGPLTNINRGGVKNPMLYGENNGFVKLIHTDADFYAKWKINVREGLINFYKTNPSWLTTLSDIDMINYKQKLSENKKLYWETIPTNERKLRAQKGLHTKCLLNENDAQYFINQNLKRNNTRKQNELLYGTWWSRLPDAERNALREKSKQFWLAQKEANTEWYQNQCEHRKSFWAKQKEANTEWYQNQCEHRKSFWTKQKEANTEWYQNLCEHRKSNNVYAKLKRENPQAYAEYCKKHNAGKNNNMFNKGYLLQGEKNGRAKLYVIIDTMKDVYIVHGNYKLFVSTYKKAHPIHKQHMFFRSTKTIRTEPADLNNISECYIFTITKEDYDKKYYKIPIWKP